MNNGWLPGETFYERKVRREPAQMDALIQLFKWLIVIGLVVALLTGCDEPLAPGVQADFYECPPNNTLRTCVVGTSPPAADMCENVGSGTTTITPINCG